MLFSRLFNGWWKELKKQTEEMAKAHAEAGTHYSFMAEELVRFSEDQSKNAQTVCTLFN